MITLLYYGFFGANRGFVWVQKILEIFFGLLMNK